MPSAKRYSVYHVKTDVPLILYATSKECAKAMGIELNTFYRYIVWMRAGKTRRYKWNVYEDEMDGEEDG